MGSSRRKRVRRKPRPLKSVLAIPGGAIDLKKNPLALGTSSLVGKRFMTAGVEALESLRHPDNPLNAVLVIWDKRRMKRQGSTPVLMFCMDGTPEEIHLGLTVAENVIKDVLDDPAQKLEGGVELTR